MIDMINVKIDEYKEKWNDHLQWKITKRSRQLLAKRKERSETTDKEPGQATT
jgi:hypothetical protein